jgi:serine beta-lactamase-like protein LACTB, mitochondrial
MVLGAGGILLAIAGLWIYVSATSTPLHPDAEHVPAVTHSDPSQRWADAVERGRQLMRVSLTEQNLPGLSVAVGVGDDIVWAEGFGWADLEGKVPVAPNMRFRIGTASVMLTSAGVGLLLEKDRLKLDEEIQTYVPEFPTKEWPVTLRPVDGAHLRPQERRR